MIIPPAETDKKWKRGESSSCNDSESENYYIERSRSRSRRKSRSRSKHVAIINLNEEIFKIINDLHRIMSQHRDALLRGKIYTQNSRYDSR